MLKIFQQSATWFTSPNGLKGWYWVGYDAYKDLKLQIGNYFYTIPSSIYISVINYSGSFCEFHILPHSISYSQPTVVLGAAFLRAYYVYFDAGNSEVMIYGSLSKSLVTTTFTPAGNPNDAEGHNLNAKIAVITFALAFCILIAV